MVKTREGFVFATGWFSTIAFLCSVVSIATEKWIVAKGEFKGETAQFSTIEYGLFGGTFKQILGSQTTFEITLTCVIKENACAYICGPNNELRTKQLKQLIRGENVDFYKDCPKIGRVNDILYHPKYTPTWRETNEKPEFLSAGLYISSVVFLCISMIFGLLSALVAVQNTVTSPAEAYFSVPGLYVYNTIGCISCVLSIALWGTLYATTIINNVGIYYTIKQIMTTRGLAYLGYSYWLLFPSCILYLVNIIVLCIRQYLINQEPALIMHTATDEADEDTRNY